MAGKKEEDIISVEETGGDGKGDGAGAKVKRPTKSTGVGSKSKKPKHKKLERRLAIVKCIGSCWVGATRCFEGIVRLAVHLLDESEDEEEDEDDEIEDLLFSGGGGDDKTGGAGAGGTGALVYPVFLPGILMDQLSSTDQEIVKDAAKIILQVNVKGKGGDKESEVDLQSGSGATDDDDEVKAKNYCASSNSDKYNSGISGSFTLATDEEIKAWRSGAEAEEDGVSEQSVETEESEDGDDEYE